MQPAQDNVPLKHSSMESSQKEYQMEKLFEEMNDFTKKVSVSSNSAELSDADLSESEEDSDDFDYESDSSSDESDAEENNNFGQVKCAVKL